MKTRRGDERGAALIELAIVLPLLTLLAVGGMELGLAWVAKNASGNAARAGGMMAVTALLDRNIDERIIQAVTNDVEMRDQGEVSRIIVYRATGLTEPPANCMALAPARADGVNGLCNVYGPDAFAAVKGGGSADDFVGPCDDSWDRWFCPIDRSRNSDELLGVHVEVEHQSATGLIPFFDGLELESGATISGSEFGYSGIPDPTDEEPPDADLPCNHGHDHDPGDTDHGHHHGPDSSVGHRHCEDDDEEHDDEDDD